MSTKSYVTFLVTILLTWIATPPLLADNLTAVAYQPKLIIAQSSDQLAGSVSTRQIRSQPDAPGNSCTNKGGALTNAQVMDGVTLTNVTLGDHTQLGNGVIIGQGVRFDSNNQIPVGTNLTAAFSSGNTLNLQTEVVSGLVLTLLQQLNQDS